jgi:hypothetical protein
MPSRRKWKKIRFPAELWTICFVVSLGFVQSFSLGFYQFRLSDLILDLGVLYCVRVYIGGHLAKRVRVLLAAYLAMLTFRIAYEHLSVAQDSMRTLLGVGAIYAAPLIFFAVREAQASRRLVWRLLFLACVISLLSQLALLGYGESNAAGMVDLSGLSGVTRAAPIQLDYVETTITIWRALSVGLTVAVLVARTSLLVKALGLIAFVLQFTGGGGSRSQLLFLILAPLVLFLRPGKGGMREGLWRLPVAVAAAGLFAAVYLWAPIQGEGLVKGGSSLSHYDRATETLVVFTGGWSAAADTSGGGFDQRVPGWEMYWNGIMGDAKVFWLGNGFASRRGDQLVGSNFEMLAHNPILDVWALSGLFGLTFFLCFIAFVINDLWSLLKVVPRGGRDEVMGLSVACSVIYMFQWLLFQAVTADRSFMIVFYLLSGLMLPTTRLLSGELRQWRSRTSGVASRRVARLSPPITSPA